jgi:hypothetical protein
LMILSEGALDRFLLSSPKNVDFSVGCHPEHNRGIPQESRSGILIAEIKTPETRRIEGF